MWCVCVCVFYVSFHYSVSETVIQMGLVGKTGKLKWYTCPQTDLQLSVCSHQIHMRLLNNTFVSVVDVFKDLL